MTIMANLGGLPCRGGCGGAASRLIMPDAAAGGADTCTRGVIEFPRSTARNITNAIYTGASRQR
jgi:hypothetical protein